jgi:hypothetical protein
MIKRESLHKKLAIAAMAGMLMLLLAASCVAQTPLNMSRQENCTNCSANASSSPGLDDTDLSTSSIRQHLEAPELVSPSGIQNTGRLTYIWRGVDASRSYCLEVRDDHNNVVIKQLYNALPAKTIYSKTPSKSLASGVYTWSILCRNSGHYQLSELMEFTVCNSLPGKATLVSPKSTIASKNPIFVWMPLSGATQYRLKVAMASHPNVPIFDEVYNAEDVFSITDQICSVGPVLSQDLEENSYYRWWIQTINCRGEGPWSYYKDFRYMNVPPGKSTPVAPQGLISSDSPTFIWTAASAATTYHLELINYQNDVDVPVMEGDFDADKVTKGSRCSVSLGPLPDEDPVYFWRVQANNDAYPYDPDGASWSGWRYFETIGAFKPGTDKKKVRMG